MRSAAMLAALCALSFAGCDKGVATAEAQEEPQVQAQPVSVQKTERYDFARLAAEGMARDKAVYDSGWQPRRPQTELALAPALPVFPTPAALPSPRPTGVQAAAAPPDVQVFGRGDRGGQRQGDRGDRGGGRGGGEQRFGGAGGPGVPSGPGGGFQGQGLVIRQGADGSIGIGRPEVQRDTVTRSTDIPLRFEAN